MAVQFSELNRNARLDAIETLIGTAPIMELRSGPPPADCATANSGTLLAQAALPSDWLSPAVGGTISKLGTWTLTGITTGVIAHFRIFDSGSPDFCHIQGTVGATGSPSYDMTVDNQNIEASQVVTVNTFVLTDGNA